MTLDSLEYISLILTPATLILAGIVVWKFGHRLFHGWSGLDKDWFILGVCLGFLGAFFDNLYWGVAWTAEYLNHPSKEFWFNHGVVSNIPFRQGFGILAALCHLKAAYTPRITLVIVWVIIISIILAAIAYSLL